MIAPDGDRLRAIPGDFDRARLADIDARLDRIRDEHRVAIGLAIESGSRAWGLPSPDSDYDCRFIFVRAETDYLSPWQRRDVIETPLVDDLDINGWDLGKTLKLLLKGNAVAIEWLMSPIVYAAERNFRDSLRAFSSLYSSRDGVAHHYLHLGERQRRTYFADGKAVSLKKLFYALRPAMALRWLRLHPDQTIAPMHFPTLMDECAPPRDVLALATELIARKAQTRELGTALLPMAIDTFLDAEFAAAREAFPAGRRSLDGTAVAAAEALFRETVARLAPRIGSTYAGTDARKAP